MKKITIMAALLGSVYFANAQVGIGISTPATSAQLDIVAENKGILIPRVELTDVNTFAPITGTQEESLLVYNTIDRNDVTSGYYYWADNQWNRVINQADLDDVSGYKEGDVIYKEVSGDWVFQYYDENGDWQTIDFSDLVAANETKTFFKKVNETGTDNAQYLYFSEEAIQNWLAADPANTVANIPDSAASTTIDAVGDVVNNFESILNQTTEYDGDTITIEQIIQEIASQVEGNVIYKNIAASGDPAEWVFQYWNGTQYLTIPLNDLVAEAESKTTIVAYEGNQYYLSETYIAGEGETDTDEWTAVPAGAILIDVVAGVVNNFETILQEETTILVDGSTTDYYTVKEYIEYISQNAMQSGVTKIVLDGSGQASFEMWNATTEAWGPVANTAFQTVVRANETRTTIARSADNAAYAPVTTDPSASDIVAYEYSAENSVKNYINVTADMIWSITNNIDVQNAITNILNAGGNVYYGDHDDDANTPDVLYTIDTNGDKTPIDISEVVTNAITNASTTQIQEIKNALGDNFNTTNIVNTGDTWIDGNPIYRGVFDATITGGTANLDAPFSIAPTSGTVGQIVSIKILDVNNAIITTATTDVSVAAGALNFKIGTGSMYQVLSATDLAIKVIVEYSVEE